MSTFWTLCVHFESAQATNLIVSIWQRVNYQSFCRMKIVRLDKVLSELRLYEARAATSPLLPGFSSKSNSPRSASSPAGGRQASPSHLTATTGAGSRTDGMGRSNGILSPRADTPHAGGRKGGREAALEVDPSLGVETAQCAHPNPDGCSVAAAAAARGGFGWMMLS